MDECLSILFMSFRNPYVLISVIIRTPACVRRENASLRLEFACGICARNVIYATSTSVDRAPSDRRPKCGGQFSSSRRRSAPLQVPVATHASKARASGARA